MTDKVFPSKNAVYPSQEVGALHEVGSPNWVVPSGDREQEDPDGDIAAGALNGFEIDSKTSSEVTFKTGEAFVGGRHLMRDTQTTVSGLSPSDGDQLVLGYDPSSKHTVEIGKPGNVSSDPDHSTPLAVYNTSGLAAWEDDRKTEPRTDRVKPADHSGRHEPGGGDEFDNYAHTGVRRGITGGSDSTTVSGNSTTTQTVSFNQPTLFSSVPAQVVVSLTTDGLADDIDLEISSKSTNSATVKIHNSNSNSKTPSFDVIAFGDV